MASPSLKLLCLAFVLYKFSEAAVGILPQQEKPEKYANQTGCYQPDFDFILGYEATYSPQDGVSCTQYLCRSNNDTIIETCSPRAVPDGCELVPGNKTLPYPDCCDTEIRCIN